MGGFGERTMYSVEPKAISPSFSRLIYAALPFSRQGVMRAIIVSPLVKRMPPLYGLTSPSDGTQPLVGKVAISKQRAEHLFKSERTGLI